MTILNEKRRNDYQGDGTTDTYGYEFKIYNVDSILIIETDTSTNVSLSYDSSGDLDGTVGIVGSGADFEITGIKNKDGGTFIRAAGNLPSGKDLAGILKPKIIQDSNIRNQGDGHRARIEDEFDRSRQIDLWLKGRLDMTIRLPESVDPDSFDSTAPIPVAGEAFRVNDAKTGYESVNLDNAAAEAAAAAASAAAAAASAAAAAASAAAALASELAAAASAAAAAASAASVDPDRLDRMERMGIVNAFKILVQGDLAIQGYVDASVDTFEDDSGIDSGASSNYEHNNTLELVENVTERANLQFLVTEPTSDAIVDESSAGTSVTEVTSGQGWSRSTGNVKFGTYSVKPFNTNNYIKLTDNFTNLNPLLNTDWTLSFFMYRGQSTDHSNIMGFKGGGNHIQLIKGTATTQIYFTLDDGTTVYSSGDVDVATTTYEHIALIKTGNDVGIYVDGTQQGYVDITGFNSFALTDGILGATENGTGMSTTVELDDICIFNSNPFGASPVVGLTDTITVPTETYSKDNGDMTLISTSKTAQSQPSTGKVSMILHEDEDALTYNTDIIAAVSRDDGTTYTNMTLALGDTLSTDRNYIDGSIDISAQPAGTDMRYKITTFNGKVVKIEDIAILWQD